MARILIADDEPHSRRLLKFRIENAGHEVTLASDGAEALERLQTERFDLLVTDFYMPRMNGRELCEAVRDGDAAPDLLIVMVTSKVEAELRDWSSGIERLSFMEKPVSPRALIELIDELIMSRAAPAPGGAS